MATKPKYIPTATAAFLAFSASGSLFAQTQAETVLPNVTVRDKTERADDNGYQGGMTRVGKLPQLPKDVPQALTIVSRQLIEDTNATTLKEALRHVSGLTFNAAEGGRTGDNMNLRGFYSFGDLYLDGIRDVAQVKRDTFNDQQVEVLRGSAAMLFGHGQAGGVINRTSKIPMMLDTGNMSATIGNNGYNRITADINKPVGENTAVRVNLMNTTGGETTRDHVKVDRQGLAAALRTGIGTDDEFALSHYHMAVNDTPDFGVPFSNGFPVSVPQNRFHGTDKDFELNNVDMTTGVYTHKFDSDRELRNITRIADYKRRLWVTVPRLNNTATQVNRNVSARGADEWTITNQTDYSHKAIIGGMKHEFLVGLELLKEQASRCGYGTIAAQPAVAIGAAPDYGISSYRGQSCSVYAGGYAGLSTAIYGQDTVEFLPGWKALFGLRRDSMDADIQNAANGVPTTRGNVKFMENSYRTALSWQPDDYRHYYVGYSDSFNPTADLYQFTSLQAVKPAERSKTLELGAKWELFEGDLSLRASIYRAVKEWERNTDVESAGISNLLSKKRHTDGIELEAAGRVTDKWEIFSGLAIMNARIDAQDTEGNYLGTFAQVSGGNYAAGQAVNATQPVYAGSYAANTVGMRPRNTPRYTFNLWNTYKLDGGWRIGLGLDVKGERFGYVASSVCQNATQNAAGQWSYNGTCPTRAPTPNTAPSYHRWDALIAYEQQSYAARLNILNLFDKYYYDSVYDNGGHAVPGTRRAFQLTMEYKY